MIRAVINNEGRRMAERFTRPELWDRYKAAKLMDDKEEVSIFRAALKIKDQNWTIRLTENALLLRYIIYLVQQQNRRIYMPNKLKVALLPEQLQVINKCLGIVWLAVDDKRMSLANDHECEMVQELLEMTQEYNWDHLPTS